MPPEDMLKVLKLLQSVMTEDDFSKYEKMVLPPPPKKDERKKLREEELWRQCQKEENLKKQVQMHLEQVKKHEHNLKQQKMMLQDVHMRLESVSLKVKALRALVAETKEPEWPPVHAPLPCPREPPPDIGHAAPIVDLNMAPTPFDTDDDDMEELGVETWRTVADHQKKRNKVSVAMKLKGTSSTTKRESLRSSIVDNTCIIDDMSCREVARALSKLTPGGLNEMVASMPPEMMVKLMGFAPEIKTIQEIQTSSSSSSCMEGEGAVESCG